MPSTSLECSKPWFRLLTRPRSTGAERLSVHILLQCKLGEVDSASSARPGLDENGMLLRTWFEVTPLVLLLQANCIIYILGCSQSRIIQFGEKSQMYWLVSQPQQSFQSSSMPKSSHLSWFTDDLEGYRFSKNWLDFILCSRFTSVVVESMPLHYFSISRLLSEN